MASPLFVSIVSLCSILLLSPLVAIAAPVQVLTTRPTHQAFRGTVVQYPEIFALALGVFNQTQLHPETPAPLITEQVVPTPEQAALMEIFMGSDLSKIINLKMTGYDRPGPLPIYDQIVLPPYSILQAPAADGGPARFYVLPRNVAAMWRVFVDLHIHFHYGPNVVPDHIAKETRNACIWAIDADTTVTATVRF